jgi:hypothetical protein
MPRKTRMYLPNAPVMSYNAATIVMYAFLPMKIFNFIRSFWLKNGALWWAVTYKLPRFQSMSDYRSESVRKLN